MGPGFESQRDHSKQYQNTLNSCKSKHCRSFVFGKHLKIFNNSQKKGAHEQNLWRRAKKEELCFLKN
jgi:hypothetical protein